MDTLQISAATDLSIRILAFARVRELLGSSEFEFPAAAESTIQMIWERLVERTPALGALSSSIRFARNGHVVDAQTAVRAGDEIALLPPVGGG